MAYCVGLTGGIGCGKSKATEMFAEVGAGIVDTDVLSRELTAPGGRAMPEIANQFGRQYVASDGSLDRPRMRELVFGDAASRKKLEAVLHPLIRKASRDLIATARTPYVIVVVPLLFETGAYDDLLDRVLVVDCDERQQIERTMARSALAEDAIRRIMETQLPREERVRRADDVLRNDGDISSLRSQVLALHTRYLSEAGRAQSAP